MIRGSEAVSPAHPSRSFDRLAALAALLLGLSLGSAGAALGAETDAPDKLTDSLIKLHGQHQNATGTEKSAVAARMRSLALARRRALLARLESNPKAVLNAALPEALARQFPAELKNLLEHEAELDGELEILHEDRPRGGRILYWLEARGERYRLHFYKDPPSHLTSGARVRVRGVRIDNAMALESGTASVDGLAAPLASTFGDQRTLVLLVNFRNRAVEPYSVEYARDLVFTKVSQFMLENSYQRTYLSGDVKGWYTLDINSPVNGCDYSQIASKADAAAAADGVAVASYQRKVYAFPKAGGCSWWGLGTVGGSPSRAWINGDLQLRVVSHELGHNLGLFHSHSLDCGGAALGHVCTISEYGDTMDTMGSAVFHFNAFQKERLGWLDHSGSPPITAAQSTGSYAIHPYETVGSGPKAIKIYRTNNPSNNRRSYFYAECRRPLGFDAGVADHPGVPRGFILHLGEESSGNSSYLLDMTPHTASWSDPALGLGESFSDPVAGVTIKPEVSCTDDLNGSVLVTYGAGACARSAPEVRIGAAKSQWVMPGKSVVYPVTVINHDENCGAADFTLAPTLPQGWRAALAHPVLNIDSGAAKSTKLTVTLPPNTGDGLYQIPTTATHGSDSRLSDTEDMSISVATTLIVRAEIDAPVLQVPGVALAQVSVTLNGQPVPRARVRLEIKRPDGRIRRVRVRTNADGIATFKYRLNRRSPTGTYLVNAFAAAQGLNGDSQMSFLLH